VIRLDYRLGSSPFGSEAPLCPVIWCQVMGALFLYWSSRWPPDLDSEHPLGPRKRIPYLHVWGKSELRLTQNVSEVSFFAARLLHKGLLVNPVKWQMSSQSVMSSKEVGNNSGLCSVKGQKSGFYNWIRARDELLYGTLCWNYLLQEFWNICSFTGFEDKWN